ncbi:MAG TPA: PH domain-containing protein [Microbacterium sp.]|nr:PH domain-containing protein [Microbacterium sp.]
MPRSADKYVFRSSLGWVWFVLAAGVSAWLLVDMAVRASVWDAFLVAPWLLLVVWFVWVFQLSPRIEADEQGARLVNLLRVVDLPWTAVQGVRLRYSAEFQLRAGGRPITAWGGASRRMHRSIRRRQAEDPAEEQVAALQRLHAQASGDPAAVRRSWDVWPLAAAGVILVWLVFSLSVTGGFVLPS